MRSRKRLRREARNSATGRSFSFWENRHARFQSHGHYGVHLTHSSVHLERVNQRFRVR
jgi:hypothetical protein